MEDLTRETLREVLKKSKDNVSTEYFLDIQNKIIQNSPIRQEIYINGYGIYDSPNPGINNNRFYLEFNLQDSQQKNETNKGTLVTLMMNPSYTLPDNQIDTTIKNIIKIANKENKAKVIVLNTLPIINSSKEEAIKNLKQEKQKLNENFLKNFFTDFKITEDTIFLAAWGSDKNINQYNGCIKKINDKFKGKIYVYSINKRNMPTHPARRGNNAIKLNNYFSGKQNLIPIEKINEDYSVTESK